MNAKQLIEMTKGKVFVVAFTKANGDKRKMLARTGVKKGLVGAGRSKPLADNLVCVYDMQNKGYRTINCNNVLSFKCGSSVL
jgi:hypothetical protein